MNHQNRYTKSLDVANSYTLPPLEKEIVLDEAKVREFDWGLFFEELQKVKNITEGKGNKKYKSLDEMLEESSLELLDAV